ILQEVIEKILSRGHQLKNVEKSKSWVFKITENCIYDFYRKQKYDYPNSDNIINELESRKENSSRYENRSIKTGYIKAIIEALDYKEGIVFILAKICSLNSIEGSLILKISPEAFRKRLSRAQKRMSILREKHCVKGHSQDFLYCEMSKDTLHEKEDLLYSLIQDVESQNLEDLLTKGKLFFKK
ncbi:MAG: sigma-70 family RNA polymerase sigma factor, partial [Spirochaetaceae bacterium]|nr:sigma-70 family RNA polymerase sigma factor [Spirochaetaceae bacterium]